MAMQSVKIGEEYVENLSNSINEPSWLKNFRFEALRQFDILPSEQSNLYTKYALNLGSSLESLEKRLKEGPVESDTLPISELASGMESGHYYVSTQTETIASK